MAKSTYLELCQTVRQECGLPGSGPASVSGQIGMLLRIVDWVASAAYEIENLWDDWDFRWSQYSTNTIINTPNYAGPSDIGTWDRNAIYLEYGTVDVSHLTGMDYKEFRDTLGKGLTNTGKPTRAIVLPDNTLTLYPTPDASTYALTADYYTAPVRMTANTDTSLIPEQWERIIIARAKMSYAAEEGAEVLMQGAGSEYGYLLDRLERDQLPRQSVRSSAEPESMVVRPT